MDCLLDSYLDLMMDYLWEQKTEHLMVHVLDQLSQ